MALNNHLRKLWEARGYSSKLGSAAVMSPPPLGFRRVYHLTSAEYAISNIVFGRMKVAKYSDLNDPFEGLAHSVIEKGTKEILAEHRRLIDSQFGLLCFSADWTDPVLWTHYAAKHRGICLGFDVDERVIKPVSYRGERLKGRLMAGEYAIDETLADLLILTKFSSWKYENEWRMMVPHENSYEEGTLRFYRFGARLRLVEVVVGALCSMSVEEVRRVTRRHHSDAVIFQARLASKSFNIVPKESTVFHGS